MRLKIGFYNNKKLKGGGFVLSTAIFILLALLLFTSELAGETVSKQKAEKMVIGWLKADSNPLGAGLGKQITGVITFTADDGKPLYYVVNLEPSGFAIVAGDDMAEPVICFAEKGTFDPSEDNPLGALVKKDLPSRIEAVRKMQKAKTGTVDETILQKEAKKAKDKWDKFTTYAETDNIGILGIGSLSDVRIPPLVLSTWGQTTIGGYPGAPACYNYYTPPYLEGDPDNYPCGCVATATSQLMRYHGHPVSYNWSNMPLEPDMSTTLEERKTIGQLCFNVANTIGTDFKPGGSEASIFDADKHLKDSFGYSNSIYGSSPATGSILNTIINPNLDASLPVLLGLGKTTEPGGHSVVCDGYGYNSSTLYHHLNLGWDGTDNAWYNLPIVDAYYYYNVIDDCAYNIYTSGTGEIISGRVTDMAGNPIPGVTISASAVGTGTYVATTNNKGIYALPKVISNKTYTVTASKPPYLFSNRTAAVGKSIDSASSSGNVWAINFSAQNESPPIAYSQNVDTISGTVETITLQAADEGLPNPPGILRYIITGLPVHGRLTDPAAGSIKSIPYTLADNGNTVEYQSCSYYSGSDSFEFVANDYGTAPSGGDSNPADVTINVSNVIDVIYAPTDNLIADWPLYTSYQQSRTQVIYLAGDIGSAMKITDLAIDIYQAPGQVLNNWTIRMKHTSRTSYSSSPYFELTGWTTIYQNNEQPTPIGWRFFHLQTPFEYNGTSNLLIDFSINNSYSSSAGNCFVTDTGVNRVLMSFANGTHGDPLTWSDATCPGLWVAKGVPNIKLTGTAGGEPIAGDFEPDCDVDYSDVKILSESWLSETGQPNFNERCDISDPIGIINFKDLAVLAKNWLVDVIP